MLKRVTMQLYTIVCTMKTKQMVTSRKTNGERHGLQKTAYEEDEDADKFWYWN